MGISPEVKDAQVKEELYWVNAVEAIIEWADDNAWFNINFITSISKHMEKGKELSDGQKAAIKNILRNFEIELAQAAE